VHFFTSTVVEWLPVFTYGKYFDIVIDSLKYCMKNMSMKLFAYVIMDNHFYLIASSPDLSKTLASIRKFTAGKIIDQLRAENKEWLLNQLAFYKKKYKTESNYQVWQESVHPELVQSPEMLKQKIEYIHNNPVKRSLVDAPEYWRYSSARNYLLSDHSVIAVDCSLV
jgi:REP element-mobilizing transposase RayT